MVTCEVCGGSSFEKHAGFLYCAVCQTQSQEYFEQEYEFQEGNVVRRQKLQRLHEKHKKEEINDGVWTSLEAFNYILYGMTQDVKKYEVSANFEATTFKLWAAYLRACKAGFTSFSKESLPKLGFHFKKRDARILYNVDMSSNLCKDRAQRGRSCSSKVSNTSVSSLSSNSRRSLSCKKNKMIADDYQEFLSMSGLNSSNLVDETLDSLGKFTESETNEESSDGTESFVKNFKKMLRRKDYQLYRSVNKSEKLMMNAKDHAKRSIRFMSKNKLLSIIHLSLLLTGSQIQLSDLLRFVREGQVSFAKVTHFFPSHVKFPKNDFSYIEVISDSLMPTHLRQRRISAQLAHLLGIERVVTPNMSLLVERYCRDLNLPGQVAVFSKRVLATYVPASFTPTSKNSLPSYEAWAAVSIMFVMKLLFGLNDRTEYFLSHLAREVNRIRRPSGRPLFVFEDWQKHIERRKTALTHYHYPTEEQIGGDSFYSCKKFLNVLVKESKDDHRSERFLPYPKYYMEGKLLDGIRNVLGELSRTQEVASMDFQSSLTPQISHAEAIFRNSHGGSQVGSGDDGRRHPMTESFLQERFENCDVEFTFCPRDHLEFIDKDHRASFLKHGINIDSVLSNSARSKGNSFEDLTDCQSTYWTLEYPAAESGRLENFRVQVLDKTPENFQWLTMECARMVEMNARDIYDELLLLEREMARKKSTGHATRDAGERQRT